MNTFTFCLLLLLTACAHSPKPEKRSSGKPYAQHPDGTDLEKIQKMFLEDYESLDLALVAGMLRGERPVLRILGGDVFLFHSGEKKKMPFLTPDFVTLKMLSHVGVGLHIQHELYLLNPNDQKIFERLQQKIKIIDTVTMDLTSSQQLLPRQRERNVKLLTLCRSYILSTLEQGKFVEFKKFANHISPLLEANLTDAANLYIDGLHQRVQELRQKLSAEEWNKLRVIVSATRQHRAGEPAMLYFQKLFKQPPGEGTSTEKKVIYAEKVWDERLSLQTLASHLIDRQIGATLFNDEYRLQGDLLRHQARRRVEEILPP
jgi:hypothetical protein